MKRKKIKISRRKKIEYPSTAKYKVTMVFNMTTGKELYYMLQPKKALICAYMASIGKNNTWEVDFNYPVHISTSGKTATLDDYCVIMK